LAVNTVGISTVPQDATGDHSLAFLCFFRV